MEKGYYAMCYMLYAMCYVSQSTIKMEKGYYGTIITKLKLNSKVAIHNKNGKGLLLKTMLKTTDTKIVVAIHNKNGKGLLLSGGFLQRQ